MINDWTGVEVILPRPNAAEGLVPVMDADATLDPRSAWRAVRDMSTALRAPTHPLPHPS